jgi:hypothetical protein
MISEVDDRVEGNCRNLDGRKRLGHLNGYGTHLGLQVLKQEI